jgi:hypothetical protein
MGYTTDFYGSFKLDRPLDIETFNLINDLQEVRHEGPTKIPNVGIWCDWAPNKDGTEIEWTGAEKFYDYVEWLEYIVNTFLAPKGYILNGEVEYQGEDRSDMGMIVVKDNVITRKIAEIKYVDSYPR